MKFSADKLGRLKIHAQDFSEQPVTLSIPEFRGESEGKAFGVRQVLKWNTPGEHADADFSIDGDPSLIGIQIYGQLKLNGEEEAHLMMQVANTHALPIEQGHTTIHLDVSKNTEFEDPDGDRTFFYTDMGWKSSVELFEASGRSNTPLRVGLNYGGATLMWRMVVRKSAESDKLLGLGVTRGYVLSGDHPKWPSGLLNGSRWGTLHPGEFRDCRMAIYMTTNGFEDLQQRYLRDLKT